MEKSPTKFNWPLLLVYLFLIGGTSALTVFLAVELFLPVGLVLTLLFATLGLIAYAFFRRGEGRAWRFVAVFAWLAAFLSLVVQFGVAGWLHPALIAALFCFLTAGALLCLMQKQGNAKRTASTEGTEWEELGRPARKTGSEELSPAERDVPLSRGR